MQLKSTDQINALVTGEAHAQVPAARRANLAARAAAAAAELDVILPGMISEAPGAAETAFLRALVAVPAAAAKPAPTLVAAPATEAETSSH